MKNTLTEEQKEALVIFMEEASECIQSASKMLRFGQEETTVMLEKEISDLLCMVEILINLGTVSMINSEKYISEKKEKLKVWSDLYSCIYD